jgi:hypothetical protein
MRVAMTLTGVRRIADINGKNLAGRRPDGSL